MSRTEPRIDELRSKMVVTENKKYSEDYLDPEKRSIANKLSTFQRWFFHSRN